MPGTGQRGMRIRNMSFSAFRIGQRARIRGTAMLPVQGEDRACYLIEFGDGTCDFWPVEDPHAACEFTGEEPSAG
jgi:hypothetical protein